MKYFLILLFLPSLSTISQDNSKLTIEKRDSLFKVWKDIEQPDSSRLNALDKLAWDVYLYSQPDSAFYYGEKYFIYAQSKGLIQKMASARTTQGASYYLRGNYVQATDLYLRALTLYEDIGEKNNRSELGVASVLNNLGIIHKEQGNFDKALEYFSRSLAIKKEKNNSIGVAITLENMGVIHFEGKRLDTAKVFFEEAIQMYQKIENDNGSERHLLGIASVLTNKGKVQKEEGQFHEALTSYNESKEIAVKFGDQQGVSEAESEIGDVYLALGNNQEAIKHGEIALEIAHSAGFIEQIEASTYVLYKAYDSEGDYAKALDMHIMNRIMSDSLQNLERKQEVLRQEYQYEYDQKVAKDSIVLNHIQTIAEAQLEAKNIRIEKDKTLMLALGLGIILSLIIIGFVYYRYTVVAKQKKLIQEQKRIVEAQSEERQKMMQEIHHRVKNNMQIIRSLLRLQANKIDDTKIVNMFEECQNRILTMASVHEHMYQSKDLIKIDISDYLKLLVERIAESHNLQQNIDLNLSIPHVKFKSETIVPLGFIINEIMTNSYKYAFEERDKGSVFLELKEINKKEFQMIIGDNGVGMNDERRNNSASLGQELIEIFTEQLDGTMERLKEPGTMFKMTFKQV